MAEARIAQQRRLIALQDARREDTAAAKSLLAAMRYSLKVLRRHLRTTARDAGLRLGRQGKKDAAPASSDDRSS